MGKSYTQGEIRRVQFSHQESDLRVGLKLIEENNSGWTGFPFLPLAVFFEGVINLLSLGLVPFAEDRFVDSAFQIGDDLFESGLIHQLPLAELFFQ